MVNVIHNEVKACLHVILYSVYRSDIINLDHQVYYM